MCVCRQRPLNCRRPRRISASTATPIILGTNLLTTPIQPSGPSASHPAIQTGDVATAAQRSKLGGARCRRSLPYSGLTTRLQSLLRQQTGSISVLGESIGKDNGIRYNFRVTSFELTGSSLANDDFPPGLASHIVQRLAACVSQKDITA